MQFTGKLNNYVCLYAQFRHRAQKTMQLGALYSKFAILCYLYLDCGWIQTLESRNITEISLRKYNQFDKVYVTGKSYVIRLDLQANTFISGYKKLESSISRKLINYSFSDWTFISSSLTLRFPIIPHILHYSRLSSECVPSTFLRTEHQFYSAKNCYRNFKGALYVCLFMDVLLYCSYKSVDL